MPANDRVSRSAFKGFVRRQEKLFADAGVGFVVGRPHRVGSRLDFATAPSNVYHRSLQVGPLSRRAGLRAGLVGLHFCVGFQGLPEPLNVVRANAREFVRGKPGLEIIRGLFQQGAAADSRLAS